jgi:hypothetical protein
LTFFFSFFFTVGSSLWLTPHVPVYKARTKYISVQGFPTVPIFSAYPSTFYWYFL